ncbi:MAG: YHYH protein, partial [Anaerolineae bacterium]
GDTLVFGPEKDGTVTSDWDYDASYGDLDQCNGITVNGEYIYLITHDYPYVSRCLMGEFTEDPPGGGQGGG